MIKDGYINISTSQKLDTNLIYNLNDNVFLKIKPELWIEWDFERNDELGLDIYKVTKGVGKKIWWICPKCKSSYDASPNNRSKGNACPYCSGKRVNHTNSLATLNPELSKEWHPTKNGELTPNDVTRNSNKKVWWLGKCGHEWEASVNNRESNKGCAYCASFQGKILVGYNDMWTTRPDMASMLLNPEDGYKYTYGSNVKVDWKCPQCKSILKRKMIDNVNKRGLICYKCKDGKGYPEKLMMSLLDYMNIEYEYQCKFSWCDDKFYDFYIKDINCIIEVHGGQHFDDKGFERVGGRTLKEEQENDKFKYELAISNNVNEYIVVDCRKSELEWIKNSIINSKLAKLYDLDNVDWMICEKNALSSLVVKACEIYNNESKNVDYIAEKLKLSNVTIRSYLKRGSAIGLCDYCPKKARETFPSLWKAVVQLDADENIVNEYKSIKEASLISGVNTTNISHCCKGKQKTAGGFRWIFKKNQIIH